MSLRVKDLKRVLLEIDDDVRVFVDLGGSEAVWPASVHAKPRTVEHAVRYPERSSAEPGVVIGLTQHGPWRIVE